MSDTAEYAPSGLRRVVTASMAGTVVEWYEFFLYATAVTLVFSKLFFPAGVNEYNAIIAGFATYAVGFVARPLGGVVFGHYGDKYGRKKLLQFSLILVGIATFAMGCLPTYGQIGIWAPILLVVLRFVQGFAVASLMHETLKKCGDNLTRENVMRQAANFQKYKLPLLLPGITINTSPTDYYPIQSVQLARFKGETWDLFGGVMSAESS